MKVSVDIWNPDNLHLGHIFRNILLQPQAELFHCTVFLNVSLKWIFSKYQWCERKLTTHFWHSVFFHSVTEIHAYAIYRAIITNKEIIQNFQNLMNKTLLIFKQRLSKISTIFRIWYIKDSYLDHRFIEFWAFPNQLFQAHQIIFLQNEKNYYNHMVFFYFGGSEAPYIRSWTYSTKL